MIIFPKHAMRGIKFMKSDTDIASTRTATTDNSNVPHDISKAGARWSKHCTVTKTRPEAHL